jgi:hypothetical protein
MNITVLLSHERSGSHFLGDFLRNLDGVATFDEVCNPNYEDEGPTETYFHRFKYNWISRHPSYLLKPSYQQGAALIKAYFELLESEAPLQSVVVDIKYGHVHNFEQVWWEYGVQPLLLTECRTSRVRILHLWRENVIEAAASAMIAEKRRVWHSWQKEASQMKGKIDLDIDDLIRRARRLQDMVRTARESWLQGLWTMDVTYERLADSLGRGGELDEALAAFVNGGLRGDFNPTYKKVTPPLHAIVGNFEDLREAAHREGFGKFF